MTTQQAIIPGHWRHSPHFLTISAQRRRGQASCQARLRPLSPDSIESLRPVPPPEALGVPVVWRVPFKLQSDCRIKKIKEPYFLYFFFENPSNARLLKIWEVIKIISKTVEKEYLSVASNSKQSRVWMTIAVPRQARFCVSLPSRDFLSSWEHAWVHILRKKWGLVYSGLFPVTLYLKESSRAACTFTLSFSMPAFLYHYVDLAEWLSTRGSFAPQETLGNI